MSSLINALYIGQFILNAANSSIAPFFPQKAKSFGIDETMIGLIFSVHPIGNFICSLLLGQQLSKGPYRKPATLLGILLTGIGVLGFACVQYIDQTWLFIASTVLARLILGVGQSLFSTPAYAYIPLLYQSTFEEKCGWMESACGVGLMAGPLFGSVLIAVGNYQTPFFFFAAFCIVLLPVLSYLIPNLSNLSTMNNNQQSTFSAVEGEEEQEKEAANRKESRSISANKEQEFEVNYLKIFKDKDIVLNYIAIFLPSCGQLFLDPTMGIYFSDTYGLNDFYVGLVFSIGTGLYILASPFATRILKMVKSYEPLLFFGSILTGFSFFFLGPDDLTYLPRKLYITCIADGVIGLSSILIYIPALPQLYRLMLKMYPDESKEVLGDVSSALYNTSYAVGEFLGPLVGGILAERFSFPRGASLFGLVIVGFSLIYAVLTGLKSPHLAEQIEAVESEDYPLTLTPSLKNININKPRSRQPAVPGLLTLGSPMSKQFPRFYTPVLRSESNSTAPQYVLQRNTNKRKQKLQDVEERRQNSLNKHQFMKLMKADNESSPAIEKQEHQQDFQFEVNSDLGLSNDSNNNNESDSLKSPLIKKERVGSHLFHKTEEQKPA